MAVWAGATAAQPHSSAKAPGHAPRVTLTYSSSGGFLYFGFLRRDLG